MSFVTTQPQALAAAAAHLEGLGSPMAVQNGSAAASTTGVVEALQALQFATYGDLYQSVSAQANAIHETLVHTLGISAGSYGATEAANSAATAGSTAGADSSGTVLGSDAVGEVGLASAMAPTGPPGFGGAPIFAGLGQASPVGALSVPPSWAGMATPVASTGAATSTGAKWTAAAPQTTPLTAMPGMPGMASAMRNAAGFGAPRYGVKPMVMKRTPGGHLETPDTMWPAVEK
ncbi:PPE family protein, SVP subgroup [Mycobacterium intracellulare]|uniref:PPE family protein, SVP subgroup n=1 Tax=Mycobacterium intracellulare TaxID=1767 RepID=UPI0006CAA9E7|nr:PE domain-containing protein [Mycobacterium intracellulare]KPN46482.1 hypothetical protein AN933_26025 [Mycobacterium intracellulare subsp. chimaera]